MKKNGFTMIELVFVIVILGVLAAVAVPRLTQSKADAEAVSVLADSKTCISDVTTDYLVSDGKTVDKYSSCAQANAAGADIKIEGNNLIVADSGNDIVNGTYKIK